MKTKIDLVRQAADGALRRIEEHRFIRAAHAGLLSNEQAIRWICCAGRESRSFPAILENMVARSTNDQVRSILQANLDDEYGSGNPEQAHFQHYLQLIQALGLTREAFQSYEEGPGISLALSLAYNISSQANEGLAFGYMLVNEGMTPITYGAARSAILQHHPTLKSRFFDMHVAIDEHHVRELYRALGEFNDDITEDVLFGVSIGERGMAVLLDEALGVFNHVSKAAWAVPVAV
jgi:pyrroloquinoline quinone (PQQ) biosynthesis protein C